MDRKTVSKYTLRLLRFLNTLLKRKSLSIIDIDIIEYILDKIEEELKNNI